MLMRDFGQQGKKDLEGIRFVRLVGDVHTGVGKVAG